MHDRIERLCTALGVTMPPAQKPGRPALDPTSDRSYLISNEQGQEVCANLDEASRFFRVTPGTLKVYTRGKTVLTKELMNGTYECRRLATRIARPEPHPGYADMLKLAHTNPALLGRRF